MIERPRILFIRRAVFNVVESLNKNVSNIPKDGSVDGEETPEEEEVDEEDENLTLDDVLR